MATVNPFQKLLDKIAANKPVAQSTAQVASVNSSTAKDPIVSLIKNANSASDIQSAIQKGTVTVPQLMSALQKIYSSEGAQRNVTIDGEQPQTYTQDILYGGGFRAWENPPEIIGVTGEGENQQPVYGPRNLGGFTQQIGDTLYVYDTKGQLLRTQDTNQSFGEQIAPVLSIAAMALSAGGAAGALGGLLAPTANAATQAAIGGALLSGGTTALTGGNSEDILKSALKGGIPAALTPVTSAISDAVGSQALGNAITSGALAKAQGGNFLQAAIQGGLSGAARDAQMNQVNQYLNTVEPGIPYDAATSPTELDVIQAFPELAPPPENLTQGVTDILNYAANAPSVQLAAGPNYVGDLSGVPYDPNYVSDSGTGAYRLEIGGTGDQQGTEPSLTTVPTQEQARIDVEDLIAQLQPYLSEAPTFEDIQSIIGQQNFATPDDIRAAISGIQFPENMTPQDVQNIVSEAFQSNPGITAIDVQDIVQGALNNLPEGLSSDDVRNIVTDAVANIPAAPTEQDIINIIGGQGLATGQDLGNLANQLGLTQQELFNQLSQVEQGFGQQVTNLESQLGNQGQQLLNALQQQGMDYNTALNEAINAQNTNFAQYQSATESALGGLGAQIGNVQTGLESQLSQQGQELMNYFQQQGLDYQTSLNEALAAQQGQFGTALNQTTEDLLNEIATSGSGLQQQFQTGLQDLADKLGVTQQELFNQLGQTQESLGTQFGGLQEQFANLNTSNAQQFSDLMKTVGLLGTGLGALQSTFKSAQEANAPKQFEIVAPPSEWKSPTYNLPTAGQIPFTPSAPIDFGSAQLLQGTQFARPQVQATQMPYDLSNVINTLNFQSVPFVQQPMTESFTGLANQPTANAGLNNIIGNLNGAPVSIADIISNIQGQYGQKAAS